MSFHRNAKHLATVLVAGLIASCASTKVVGTNIQRVANGAAVDQKELTTAWASDTKHMEANLATLHSRFEAAYAVLKTNVQKRWGQNDAKAANRTVYLHKKACRVPSIV